MVAVALFVSLFASCVGPSRGSDLALTCSQSSALALVQLSAQFNRSVVLDHRPSKKLEKAKDTDDRPSEELEKADDTEEADIFPADPALRPDGSRYPNESDTITVQHFSLCLLAVGLVLQAWIFRSKPVEITKEELMGIGLASTALLGGGIIFGFSAFAEQLIEMPNSPFNTSSVSTIFAIGHQIMVVGCIVGGFALDYVSPRAFAVSGFAIEAIGHVLLMHAETLPEIVTIVSYGLIGWGGCQIFLVALTFVSAFERCNLLASILTSFFQAGGFVFMVLPYTGWKPFFFTYSIMCIVGGCVAATVYPTSMLDECPQTEDEAASTNEMSLGQVLSQKRVIWFLISFTVCGSALIYGIGEVPAALRAKDSCQWDEVAGDFIECRSQNIQDQLNNAVMPFVGNFIVPCSVVLGYMIDRWGFAMPAVINVISVQAFLGALQQLNLIQQYGTALLFNIANSTVFTVQNAYICSLGSEHVGRLFAISNILLGLGNFLSDWLNTNPFGSSDSKVTTSVAVSCVVWFIATCPCYLWALFEYRHQQDPAVEDRQRKVMTPRGSGKKEQQGQWIEDIIPDAKIIEQLTPRHTPRHGQSCDPVQ